MLRYKNRKRNTNGSHFCSGDHLQTCLQGMIYTNLHLNGHSMGAMQMHAPGRLTCYGPS